MLPRTHCRLLGRYNCSTRFFWLLPIQIALNWCLLRSLLNRRLLQLSRRIIAFLRRSVYFTSLLDCSLLIFWRWRSLNVDSGAILVVPVLCLLLDLFTAGFWTRLLQIALDRHLIGICSCSICKRLLIILLTSILEGTAAHLLVSGCFGTCVMNGHCLVLLLRCGWSGQVWDSMVQMIHSDHLIEHLELILLIIWLLLFLGNRWSRMIHSWKLIRVKGFPTRLSLFKSAPARWVRPLLWLEASSCSCGDLRVLFDEMLRVVQDLPLMILRDYTLLDYPIILFIYEV